MNVLLTNDDGFDAIGLKCLAQAVIDLGFNATIVAPKKHMSGASRGRVSGVNLPWLKENSTFNIETFSVDGSPASCVVFALTSGLFSNFDFCLSGINAGENLGGGLTISGTFGAALEAISYGIPAIAISREYDEIFSDPNGWDWTHTLESCKFVLEQLLFAKDRKWDVANINIPNFRTSEVQFCSVSQESYFYDYYDVKSNKIISRIGYEKQRLSSDDDIFVLTQSRAIGVSLLSGLLK